MTTSTGITRREVLKRGAVTGAGLLWVTPSAQAFGMTSVATEQPSGGNQGCTPGYWKNSPGTWPAPFHPAPGPSIKVALELTESACVDAELLEITLGDALALKGGGVNALLRHAAAGLLNAYALPSFYPSALVWDVSQALLDCDPDEIEALKNMLAAANEAGCPLANDNSIKG